MNIFDSKRKAAIKVSRFRPNFNFNGSFYPGYIYPVMCKKVMPGDTWYVASNPKLYFQPMVSPMLNNVKVDIRYFYVRNPLIWSNFDQYLTGQVRHGTGPSNIVHPYFTDFILESTVDRHSTSARLVYLLDSLYGCRTGIQYKRLNPLPARAYSLIFNEYYRAEFIQPNAPYILTDGPQAVSSYVIKQSCYRKDYFTSALPAPQWGEGVALPGLVVLNNPEQKYQHWKDPEGGDVHTGEGWFASQGSYSTFNTVFGEGAERNYEGANLDPNGTLAVNIDIRDLRTASAVQRFLEKSAIGGNRYAEYMLTHFGVRTPDNSTFRPQYLGGGDQYINISPVEQNSESANTPQGTLAGRGRVDGLVGMNHAYFFTEHGWIMAMMTIRPEAEYYGGIARQNHVFEDVLDNYCVPIFQNVGMQAIRKEELSDATADPEGTFGYTEQYIDYKTFPNEVHGELRGSLRSWLATRGFTTEAPALNNLFLVVSPDCFSDQMAVNNYPPLVGQIHHDIIVKRPLQYHAGYKLG